MSEILFNKQQLLIVNKLQLGRDLDTIDNLFRTKKVDEFSLDSLLDLLKVANALYRAGFPIIDDAKYDLFIVELKAKQPNHPYLTSVEPELLAEAKTVALPQKMLSTDKAYSFDEIKKWVKRLLKAANDINFDPGNLQIRVTPKLDGYAAFDDGTTLYTRGDGTRGQDITRAFNRGLQVAESGNRGQGPGEIVIKKSYFDTVLSGQFENSRNIQAAIIAEKTIDESIQKAIDEGACVFYPFALIENWTGHFETLLADFEAIIEKIWNAVDFDVDGVILEVIADEIKANMGATRHHHRWQIAFKINEESAEVEVKSVTPQTSRTGRVTPVAELVPTKLSGATISRVTVHHYNMVKANGVGCGAVVQLVRSGLVIPKIEKVIKSVEPDIPDSCPSCHSHIIWESDHLVCPNKTDCPAQTENTLIHFFKTLANNDGFGPKVIEKLHGYGVKRIHELYEFKPHQLIQFGFGEKTAQNLITQLTASKEVEIEDWRFLAAFGVSRLGGGNCEKLLQHHDLPSLFELSVEEMIKIDGFAQVSAEAIFEGLEKVKEEFFKVYSLGFNLAITEKLSDKSEGSSVLFGKQVVFTGSMTSGSRGDMEKHAKSLGAKVGKSVSGKTTYLITGEKVGVNKINAAKGKGVTVLTEAEYLSLIA